MANLSETPNYDSGIYQIETTDPVLGGPSGIANAQAKSLANRTAFLKQQIDQLNSGTLTPSWIASQSYVQGELQKLDSKQSARAATTQNITLSGVQTIDGVTLGVGDRVLVKDQTNANQNGIYLVATSAWARPADADSGTKLTSGARVAVEEGAINAGKVWYLATTGAISVGATELLFSDEHPSATESLLGLVKVATQEQADSGTADDVVITPKKLRAGFSMLAASSGYLALPSWLGGFIFQWMIRTTGTVAQGALDQANVNWPITFPTTCYFCGVSQGSGNGQMIMSAAENLSLVTLTAYAVVAGQRNYRVFAFGR